MQLKELIRSLARRWYVVLAGLALTAGMCAVVYERVPATYEASGSLVLMPPSATVGATGNPYLYLVGMSQALDVLTRRANAAEVRAPVLENFPAMTYSVDADRSTSGAVVVVKVSSPNPGETMGGLKAALGTVPATLKAMQDELSVPEYSRINLKTIVVAPESSMENKAQLQLIIVTAGAGAVGTVLLARMLDGLLLARRMRRGSAERPAPGGSTETPDPAPGRRPRRLRGAKSPESRPLEPDTGDEESVEPAHKANVRATLP
ncbi:hypothetical protein [Arthrobacter sp. NicSoilB8]|uniref:hypothetical protein n=1 Tax=Arthrobacter sp. NicSoilB8 TaxID=2830998 RepID=UPI001CC67D45|nr:hypothetical protein [Arthrobacter sp. NicSoilB8]BCW73400.1 hypothetical protein NicSoilB8_44440 [Arthrobacter sp. NicSoilB8]